MYNSINNAELYTHQCLFGVESVVDASIATSSVVMSPQVGADVQTDVDRRPSLLDDCPQLSCCVEVRLSAFTHGVVGLKLVLCSG